MLLRIDRARPLTLGYGKATRMDNLLALFRGTRLAWTLHD